MKRYWVEVPRELKVYENARYLVIAETEQDAINKAMNGEYDDNTYEEYDSEEIDSYWNDVEVTEIKEGEIV